MSFASPLLLATLLVVPLAVAGYVYAQRRRMRYAIAFTNLDVLASVVEPRRAWRRVLPPALFLLALALACVALARPQVAMPTAREDATVVLVVDISGSMLADDVEPTRLAAAKQAIGRFVDRLPARYRIGLVTFAGEAVVSSPISADRQLLRDTVAYLEPGFGTSIGDALARAVEVARGEVVVRGGAVAPSARPSDRPPISILLLSDGAQTQGRLRPLEGAARAKALAIPVYTIALGTPRGVIQFGFPPYATRVPVPPDPVTLRRIADETGGRFFDAPSAEALTSAYDALGSRVSRTTRETEATFAFLGAAALSLLASAVLSGLWFARLP